MKLYILTTYTLTLLSISSCTKESSTNEPTANESITKVDPKEEWHNLIADDNLSQWTTWRKGEIENASAWEIKDGVLYLKKTPELKRKGGSIVTLKPYVNFEFKFEFKIAAGGNSGIKYRSLNNLGLEYQILDDINGKDNKNPKNKAASIYQLVAAPNTKKLNPVGEWNTGRIIANGNQLEHWLNGEKVAEIEMGTKRWKEAFAKSKYKSKPNFAKEDAQILLQDHGDEVSFRNLLIKELK